DRRPDADLVVEVDDVGDVHADAAVRGSRADRRVRVGAMDAGPAVEAHPARLDRVVGPGRDDLAGQVARPVGVGHVPGRVDLLLLDRVQAGGRLETLAPDGDRVAAGRLEALVERQAERGAVDDDHRAIAIGELAGGDLRL